MTTQKTGTTIPTNGKKPEATAPVVSISKTTPAKEVELTPIEKSLQFINELVELQKQHTRLILSGQKLSDFVQLKGEENIELTLTDENNRKFEFSTKNPEVLNGVISCLRSMIQEKRTGIETKLIDLKIAA